MPFVYRETFLTVTVNTAANNQNVKFPNLLYEHRGRLKSAFKMEAKVTKFNL